MAYKKFKFAFSISGVVIFMSGTAPVVLSSDTASDTLLPSQIFEKVQGNYASLSSYSDEGQVISAMGDSVTTTGFTIRLARTNFYRVEWERYSADATENTGPQVVWCSGAGNFLDMGWGMQWQYNREIALANAAAGSGGAAATIPRMFFDLQRRDQPDVSMWIGKRQSDEKIGNIDCYVLTKESQGGETNTFWIGKQDFLIYQVRTVISAEAMQAAWAGATKGSSGIVAGLQGFTSIETHTNIVLNKMVLRSDFVPSFPLFEQRDQE